MTDLIPYLIAAAVGAVAALAVGVPLIVKLSRDRKPLAAKAAVSAIKRLSHVLNEDDEDDAQRRKAELDLQLRRLADLTSELSGKS